MGSDGWCCGGQWLLGHTMLDGESFFFFLLIWGLFGFEVWIMWCLMVGIVWVWNQWVCSDGWCCGSQRLLGHTMLTNGSGFCFEFYFIFWIYLRWDVGWLIGWVDLCLIALCDTGPNWVDLGLMEGGFLFLECNVNFYFSKWECIVLIWKTGTGLVIFFYNLSQNTCLVYIFWIGLSFKEKRLCYGAKKKMKKQRTWEKKLFGESDQTAIHTFCF